jgi:hypothetical protein
MTKTTHANFCPEQPMRSGTGGNQVAQPIYRRARALTAALVTALAVTA